MHLRYATVARLTRNDDEIAEFNAEITCKILQALASQQ